MVPTEATRRACHSYRGVGEGDDKRGVAGLQMIEIVGWLLAIFLAGVVAVSVRTDENVDAEDFFWPVFLWFIIVGTFAAWWDGDDDDDENDPLTPVPA